LEINLRAFFISQLKRKFDMKIGLTKEYVENLYYNSELKMPEVAKRMSTDFNAKVSVADVKRAFDKFGLKAINRPRGRKIEFEIIEETEVNIVEDENLSTDSFVFTAETQPAYN
jgi:hypothetical protein